MPDVVVSKGHDDLSGFVDRAIDGKERVRIVRSGQDVAAVIPIEDLELLEELEDRLDILEAFDAIEEARLKGGIISWEEFEAELGLS
jgi:prevent-host-death family protein